MLIYHFSSHLDQIQLPNLLIFLLLGKDEKIIRMSKKSGLEA